MQAKRSVMNDGCDRISKETNVSPWRHHPCICLEGGGGICKIMKASVKLAIAQMDSKQTPPEYKSRASPLHKLAQFKLGRFHPFIGHKGPQGEQRYSSTLFLTSALEGGGGSVSRPCRTLPPGKTRYPLYRRLGGPEGRSGQVRKISPPPGFDLRTIQPVGSRYTEYATRSTHNLILYPFQL